MTALSTIAARDTQSVPDKCVELWLAGEALSEAIADERSRNDDWYARIERQKAAYWARRDAEAGL